MSQQATEMDQQAAEMNQQPRKWISNRRNEPATAEMSQQVAEMNQQPSKIDYHSTFIIHYFQIL